MKALVASACAALLLVCTFFLAASPTQAQTYGTGTKGWCTFWGGSLESCHPDPIAACKAQYNWGGGGGTFQGAEPTPEGNEYFKCKWTGVPYPSLVRFMCHGGYTLAMPFTCIPNGSDDADSNNTCGGNPIEIISGRKYDSVVDFATADGLLKIERKYTSKRSFVRLSGGVLQYGGAGWSFDFGPQIQLDSSFGSSQRLWLNLPDGGQYGFQYSAGSASFVPIDATADATRKTRFSLTLVGGAPGNWSAINTAVSTWLVTDRRSGTTYTIVSRKRPSQTSYIWGTTSAVSFRGGYGWTLTHGTDAEITSLTDSYGRTLTFDWYSGVGLASTHKILIKQITLPNGTALNYTYKRLYTSTLGTAPQSWFDVLSKAEHVLSPSGSGPSNLISATSYHYEDGRFPYFLTGITDARGVRYASWTYDALGRGASSFHGAGADMTTFAYASPTTTSRVHTVTNALGKNTVYTFAKSDAQWLLTSVDGQASTNCVASNSTSTYTAKLLDTVTDEEGRITKYVRNSDGLPTKITQAFGTSDARATDMTWRTDQQIATLAKPGLSTAYGYDPSDRLSTVTETDTTSHSLPYSTNGQTRTWTYSYTSEGKVASVDGPLAGNADSVTYTYDTSGGLRTVTDELGHITEITSVDGLGRPLAIEDANGIVTELGYSAAGYLESITVDPTGANAVTAIGYDAIGQMTSLTRDDGSAFTYGYDAARRLTSTTDAKGNVLTYAYDNMGNVTLTEIDDNASTLLYSQAQTFDELGRLLTSVGVGSATWSYSYDKVSNLKVATDPRNNSKTYAYDGLNELIRTVDEASNAVDLTRDGQGQVIAHTDPRLIETEYVRNGWGEVIQEYSPDIGVVVYERNALGQVTKRTDAEGRVRDYAYDVAGRLTSVSYPSSSGEDSTFTYDDATGGNLGIGRLTGFANPAGDTTRVYNSLGLLASERLDGVGLIRTTSYQYDAAGNVEEMIYPSGRVVTVSRDLQGTITGISTQTTVLDPVTILADGITWQPFGASIAGLTFGNGLEWERSYDLDYRLTQQKLLDGVTAMIQRSYEYGDGLNLTEANDDLAPANDETYAYSANNMLSAADGPWGADTFSYDGVGNITSHVNVFGGSTADNQADYSPTANHMTAIEQNGNPVRSFTYDATGNVETDTVLGVTTEYRYNHEGRMYAVERGGNRLGEYYYNVFGQLVLRIVTNTVPSGWTMYFYDQQGRLITEYDGISGDLLREYVWLGDTPIAVIEAGGTPAIHYIHTDHIGRPIALTDAGGNFVNETTWVVFGNAWSVTGSVGVDLRFPGQMYQFESGLHYNWNRQYDPSIARYTQPDPLGLVDGPSRYAYVRNDPLQKVDPDGQFAILAPLIPAIPGIASGIAGAVSGAIAGAIIWPTIIPNEGTEAGQEAGICVPTDGDREYCHRQYEMDEDQCYKDYSYNRVDLRGCIQRAENNRNLCLRGSPEVAPWGDFDVDGWQPPKRKKW